MLVLFTLNKPLSRSCYIDLTLNVLISLQYALKDEPLYLKNGHTAWIRMNTNRLTAYLLLSLSMLSLNGFADVNEPRPEYKNHFSIGPGVQHNSAAYHGQDGYFEAMPVFSFRYGSLYGYNQHNEPTIGFNLFNHKRISLAIAATRSRAYLDVSEISADKEFLFWGIEDKDEAYEAGLVFNYFSRVGLLEIKAFKDVMDTYDGARSSIAFSRPFPQTGNWTIVPRMFIKHYSEKFNAYYYGVSEGEHEIGQDIAQANGYALFGPPSNPGYNQLRPEYEPGNSGHWGIDIKFEYKFTENLLATGYLLIEKFSGPVETSPLTEDKELILTALGIRYGF